MDYRKMMMETPEETMKRFERKRKLKETLCEFGLITHKVRVGNTTHFAFALATPTGTPIAHPCSSEDLAECSQWLASKYPTHFFFQDQSAGVYESQGATGSGARFGITTPSDSKSLQCNATSQLTASMKSNVDLYPNTELRSYDRICEGIKDKIAVELRGLEDQRDDARHCDVSTPAEIFLSPWDTPLNSPEVKRPRIWNELKKERDGPADRPKPERRSGGHGHGHEQFRRSRAEGVHHGDREMGHTERRERGVHGEHRHRKDRSTAYRHHSSRDGARANMESMGRRGGGSRGMGSSRRGRTGTNRNQTSRSDEDSGICEKEIYGLTKERLDPTSRMTARLRNVEKWDCLKQSAGSSDISLSPEPYGFERLGPGTRSHRNGTGRRSENGVAFDSRHGHRTPPTTDHFQNFSGGVDTRLRERQGDYPECDLVVADEDLTHQGGKSEKILAWKPSPLYRASATPAPEKSESSFDSVEVLEVALAHKGSYTFRPICGKNGHKGRILVEFPPSRQAWVDATTLHKQFKMNARGYTEWLAVKPRWRNLGPDSIKDGTDFVRLDDTGNPKRVLYGYLAESRHMEVFDPSRKYVQNWKIVSKKLSQ